MTSQDVNLTIAAVRGPEAIGNSKKWEVITSEDPGFDLAVWSENGAQDLESLKFQQVTMTVEPSIDPKTDQVRTFNNREQWRVVKTPGWTRTEKGSWGGGGGNQQPRDQESIIAQTLVKAGVEMAGPGADAQTVDANVVSLLGVYQRTYAALKIAASMGATPEETKEA